MDDESPNWMDEDTPAEGGDAPPAPAEGGEGGEGGAAPGEGGAPAEGAPPAEEEVPPPPRPRDPNRPIYFRVWNRPRHLHYNYLYEFRHNYYDDVIDYLDKRQRGTASYDIPRPQTWAERALRTDNRLYQRSKDDELLHKIRMSNHAYHYHTREFFNRTHSSTYI